MDGKLMGIIEQSFHKGYYEGFVDACDILTKSLTEAISNITTEIKETALESKDEVIKEKE